MIRARVEIGRDVQPASESAEGIDLIGRVRLLPGRPVDVVSRPAGTPVVRRGFVHSWRIVKLGSGGPIYRGSCVWEEVAGNEIPVAGQAGAAERGN